MDNIQIALSLLKARLGINSTVRDDYLIRILDGLFEELQSRQGIPLDLTNNSAHLMFLVDYAEYRYSNVEKPDMPRHLQWRLHNLIVDNNTTVGD